MPECHQSGFDIGQRLLRSCGMCPCVIVILVLLWLSTTLYLRTCTVLVSSGTHISSLYVETLLHQWVLRTEPQRASLGLLQLRIIRPRHFVRGVVAEHSAVYK
ncbi:uncharacterized protein EI97DRAFT_271992 [Westerdykella ornata]|uniref:Uncharacterized protein n=1 Tax=Westerdykella ornata TaxID=318751 RepID=A0A6A6JPB8_WESOR|nr:uncharacterized protein EI97DRAFT_271992 [Westerdykella ornata]KAF2277748.1 hypothetical protein EI97DRAFT_271992 [Westerdykella ornata]